MDLSLGFLFCSIDLYFCLCKHLNLYLVYWKADITLLTKVQYGFSSTCIVTQSCPSLCDPMYWIPPDSSVHGILQARILEWVAMPFSRGFCLSRDQIQVSCIMGRYFPAWATSSHVRMWELDYKEGWVPEWKMLSNCGAGEHSRKSLGLQGDQTSQS